MNLKEETIKKLSESLFKLYEGPDRSLNMASREVRLKYEIQAEYLFDNSIQEILNKQKSKLDILEKLPNKLAGYYLALCREDNGWWIGYENSDLRKEKGASGKTIYEAVKNLIKWYFPELLEEFNYEKK